MACVSLSLSLISHLFISPSSCTSRQRDRPTDRQTDRQTIKYYQYEKGWCDGGYSENHGQEADAATAGSYSFNRLGEEALKLTISRNGALVTQLVSY
jgi:hypothetical protein